jgi:hypothetical protein
VALALYLGWIILARLGALLELAPGVRAWYPPAALVAAACLLWGARALVPLILGAVTLALWSPPVDEPLWRLVLVSILLTVIYWLGARTLRLAGFDPRFRRPADVARFGLTFMIVAAAAALVGAADARGFTALADGEGLRLIRALWTGDLVAVFALTPALLAGGLLPSSPRSAPRWTLSRRDLVQIAGIPVAILTATLLAPRLGFFAYAVCLLPLGWIALEHGSRLAAVATVLITLGTLPTLQRPIALTNSLEVQTFIGLLAITGLLIGSVADDRARALALLHQSEERYRSLVELLPDPLVVHAEGRILFANSAAVAVFAAGSAAELVGRALPDLADPSSRALIEKRIGILASGKGVSLVHHTMRRLDGSGTVELESVSTPISFQGRAAALTVARDVTARLRLEMELRHAQRMEAVGRLAGGIAHDFNNLLTVITSYGELILADVKEGEALGHDVREILHAANRAAAMTRQLLSFSRRQVLAPAPLDVNEVVTGMETLLRRLIGPEIAILSRLDPSVGIVLADKGQLEQVIVNLAVNARDAMPEGGVLAIETCDVAAGEDPATARCAPAERYTMIVMRDTGGGIDAEALRHIFDPFFTTKEVGQGTGLGLATVHGIVEQSGGAVAVDSHVGAGSAFRILLPALPPAEVGSGASAVAASRAAVGRGLVLLVEDDATVRDGVARMLRAGGYEVVEATDGAAALDVLSAREGRLDLLLSDIAMPKMNGHRLAREVRERWPSLPVILSSGFADPAEPAGDLGEFTVLQKPFELETLTWAIQTALRGRPAAD